MRKAFMVLAAALIALPIFAEQKTPTPVSQRVKQLETRASKRVVQPTVTPIPAGEKTNPIKSTKSNTSDIAVGDEGEPSDKERVVQPAVTPIPAGENIKIKSTKSNGSLRSAADMTPTPSGEKTTTINSTKGNTFKVAGTVTPTAGPLEVDPHGTTINNSHSNSYKVGGEAANVTVTPAPVGAVKFGRDKMASRQGKQQLSLRGKVISQSGNILTVLANGKEVTFSGAKLKALPKVGETVDISYTQTSGGPLEVVKIKSTKSNASE
jgi:hypothetical protein